MSRQFIAKLTEDGELDCFFGTNGRIFPRCVFGNREIPRVLLVDDDGKIVMVGSTASDAHQDRGCIFRFRDDGSYDDEFSHNGRAGFGGDVEELKVKGACFDRNGNIVVAATQCMDVIQKFVCTVFFLPAGWMRNLAVPARWYIQAPAGRMPVALELPVKIRSSSVEPVIPPRNI
jgi:hypothetical protein